MAATPSIIPSSMLTSMTCAPASTCWRATLERGAVVVLLDEAAEPGRPGDVGALADVDEQAVLVDDARLEPGQAQRRRDVRRACAACPAWTPRRSRRCAAGVVPQQPPTMLTSPAVGELADDPGHRLGGLVVLAEGVGQPGVRVGRDEAVGDARQLGDVGAQLAGAQRAVQADGQRAGVPHRVPERLGDLTRQGAAGGVGDGAGDHHRPAPVVLLEERLERVDGGLGVERVEDGLDEQHVGAAVDQAAGLLQVGLDQLVVGDVAGAGVVDVGRDGCRAVRRPERAQHPARPVGRALGHGVGLGARQGGRGDVHLVGDVLHRVVGQRDALRVEGVGLEQVGARPRGTCGAPRG